MPTMLTSDLRRPIILIVFDQQNHSPKFKFIKDKQVEI